MYAFLLGAGCNLLCRSLKCATVKDYIKDVASFLILFSKDHRDYRFDSANALRMSSTLHNVFEELKTWDDMAKRREPFTLDMLTAQQQWTEAGEFGPDTEEAALLDWFEVGLFTGMRLAEWAQPSHKSDPACPNLNKRLQTAAFCLNDVRAEMKGGQRISGAVILDHPVASIKKMWVKWRMQKNGENGEEKMFSLPESKLARSFIRPMYRILQRFVRLRGIDDLTTPLSVYQHAKAEKGVRLLHSANIEKSMRRTAAKVYNLDKSNEVDAAMLQRWSSHSIRVGACCILHAMGFDAIQIKFILRWKSDTFMLYLRNNGILADQQHRAFDKLGAMPNF